MKRSITLLAALLLAIGMMAVPAAADDFENPGQGWERSQEQSQGESQGKGCPFIGVSWSWWATAYAHGEWHIGPGEWTSMVATEGSVPDSYEEAIGVPEGTIGDGPGVYSRVLATYCEYEPGS